MAPRRVTVFLNAAPKEGKLMPVEPGATLESFLAAAGQRLGVQAKRLYLRGGGEVEHLSVLRDDDAVFVSAGEPYGEAGGGGGAGGARGAGDPTYSIAVMGPGSVGKSAMTLQYVQGVFVIDYDPTIEDAYRKQTSVDGQACVLDILDTAGQEDYTALRSTWMRERDGFLLVFSVTERPTFDDLASFYDQLQVMHEDRMPPLLLAGNKADLAGKRVVDKEEGERLAEEWGACAYVETSAKTGQNIDTAFSRLVREMREGRQAPGAPVKKKRRFCAVL